MRRIMPVSQKGFSLVEIAVVLVVIGLLIGGVMAGLNLVRAAEVRGVITEAQTYRAAVNTFNDKFRAIPGDMVNATDYWGIAGGGGTGAACFTVDSSTLTDTKRTCNGDGDRIPTVAAGSVAANAWYNGEKFRFWQHLANADMIGGRYSGRTDSTSANFAITLGKNAPPSKVEGGVFMPYGLSTITVAHTEWFNGMPVGAYLQFRGVSSAPLSPIDAETLDAKMDDGFPASGIVRAPKSNSVTWPDCTTSTSVDAKYNHNKTDKRCMLIIYLLP